MRPQLCYVADCLPGATAEERLRLASRLGLRLELAHTDAFELEPARRLVEPAVTLQAFGMHSWHPLSHDPRARAAAGPYVRHVLELAAELRIPRVLTACGFGRCVQGGAMERCLEFYGGLLAPAREAGVRVLIEPLSPLRADAMNHPGDVAELLSRLDAPDVFSAALDTGHLVDGGHEVESVLRSWREPLEELQLRGPRGAPPEPDLPLNRWLSACANPPAIVAVEHREPIGLPAFHILVRRLRAELASRP